MAARPMRILETVRAYGTELTHRAGDGAESAGAIAPVSLLAQRARGTCAAQWLDRVRDDLENYRGALGRLIERRRPSSVRHREG